ncbi:glycosyltransferase family 4 protein [Streptomyces halstedii]|uniref:glycosyltransferase family 4 protein n=1 Tax=Streptomyces TaxID=1883 RepID=UPI00048D0633|nr:MULTISPECIES: glycosyltransferase family 4 protein [Streptomyces]MYR74186.1 glycosyltransferase [Streptomyces sp. SID4925]MYY19148.1 glycosyltransferase [Streptomyces sp. SID4912]MCW8218049.1 glycosyltransferase family 4 protein [Streptomyces griseolus]SBU92066.1 Glycosyltransferase involved in cell wall bisynthesis [Streptomyces sp. OspMP-M45]SCD65849.1 Glycosyltransferase involved in cell wall bisynthesis [Streptomyces sp. PpalLS-921]
MSQLRTVQVLGGGAGSSAHVTSLATGLVARGVQVTVCAPADGEHARTFPATGARFTPVPRRGDPASVVALRAACADADVVHAHGLHAAVRAGLALSGRSTPLVMTWHHRAHAEGARRRMLHLLERRANRAAAVVLGTSSELVDRARLRGARDARLAPAAMPPGRPTLVHGGKARAELGAVGRPLLVSAGVLAPHHGYHTLLDAVHGWRELDPVPLLVVAGEGREEEALRHRVVDEGLPVVMTGRRDDLGELLAAADLAVVPGREDGRPAVAREALRLGVPLVAAGSGAVRDLVGQAAELVPYGDAPALTGAVLRLLGDPGRREQLAGAGRRQAAGWPTEEDTVAHVLSVYDELAQPLSVAGRG